MLLERAQRAASEGNYGIAAALVIRAGGDELISLANNTMFADRDPAGHAEMNAIRQAHDLARSHDRAKESLGVTRRKAPIRGSESVLFTTLEPCPMCTVCAINAGVSRVVIATPDPLAGAMAPARLEALAPIWSELVKAGGPTITFCQADDPDQPLTYVPRDLLDSLKRTFEETRTRLDEVLGRGGLLDPQTIVACGGAV
jgi:tRNA(Arg) A34 adenosine deaminase TadA